jgi:hypothetical protein
MLNKYTELNNMNMNKVLERLATYYLDNDVENLELLVKELGFSHNHFTNVVNELEEGINQKTLSERKETPKVRYFAAEINGMIDARSVSNPNKTIRFASYPANGQNLFAFHKDLPNADNISIKGVTEITRQKYVEIKEFLKRGML